MPLIPAVHVDPNRRQTTVEPFLPAEPIGSIYPTPSVVPPAHSNGRTTSTPLSTIITLTVTSVVIVVAFAFFVVYRLQKFKIEEIKRRYERPRMRGKRRWPVEPPPLVQKEIYGGKPVLNTYQNPKSPADFASTRCPPHRPIRAQAPTSDFSSEFSSEPETCSCEVNKSDIQTYPGPFRSRPPRYPPRIQKVPAFYPKSYHSERSRWYKFPKLRTESVPFDSNHFRGSVDPRWRTVGTRDSRGIDPNDRWAPPSSHFRLSNTDSWSQSSPSRPPTSRVVLNPPQTSHLFPTPTYPPRPTAVTQTSDSSKE